MAGAFFEFLGIGLSEIEFYILLILLFSIVASALLFFAFKARSGPAARTRAELSDEFSRLGADKARLKASMTALEETKNTGRISEQEYKDQLMRAEKKIARINADMDKILDILAFSHYDTKLQQERGLEVEKMNLLVKLQEDANDYKRKAEGLEAAVQDFTKRNQILESENEGLKQRLENIESSYKERLISLEEELDAARKSTKKSNPGNPGNPGNEEERKYKDKMEEYYHKILLYQLLVSRYNKHIESSETKTVPDLKSLVQPTNSNITPIIQNIKSESKDPMRHYQSAYEAIGDIHSVPRIETTFWLTIKEMLDNKVADYDDKAILLCSILRGLGANSKVVVALMSDGSNRPLVMITLKEKSILLDPNRKHEFLRYVGKREALLKQFSVNGQTVKRILYEFNDKDYIPYEA